MKKERAARSGGRRHSPGIDEQLVHDLERMHLRIIDLEAAESAQRERAEDAAREIDDLRRLVTVLSGGLSNRADLGELTGILLERLNGKTRTAAHRHRLAVLLKDFSCRLSLTAEQQKRLLLLGRIHDIGKAVIDAAILMKPERLSDLEWSVVKRYPETGFFIARSSEKFADAAGLVLAHAERWDGTGYPEGLKGGEIPFEARVFAVADAYDVMTHWRPYALPFSHDNALVELMKSAGAQFDPDLVQQFIDMKTREEEAVLR